jgi:membrane fusion protein (multidrug efflux system)
VPKQVWVTANFKEDQIGRMRPGQRVEIEVDALHGRKFRGLVDSIQAGSGARFSLLPPQNATGNYVKVYLYLRSDDDILGGDRFT